MTPVAVLCIVEQEKDAFFPPATIERLRSLCDVRVVAPDELADQRGFARSMGDVEIAITSWRFPRLDAEMLALAPKLRLVMHSGSSVKFLVSDAFWESGVRISQAGAAMAPAVAEMSLALTLAMLRRLPMVDHALHAGAAWNVARRARRGMEMSAARIGVIGASRTGRSYIELCTALDADTIVYDPYLDRDDPLAERSVSLSTLLESSDVVAIHAPVTQETVGMLGHEELALIRDGGIIVNTARSDLLDMSALYVEVASGRLDVAMDVYDVEPLPEQDRWRALVNVLLTPHIAGATLQSRHRAGGIVIDEVARFIARQALTHEVRQSDLERIG